MSLVAEKENAVNVLLIIGIWVSFLDVYSLPKQRELTTARLKNLSKPISKTSISYIVFRISYIVKKKEKVR